MSEIAFARSPFDRIRTADENGECWYGRALMPLMQYTTWQRFATVVEKAMASLSLVQGSDVAARNFSKIAKVGAHGPASEDYRLTRFGAYLVAMAGDDTKAAVAQARVYFAVKAREAEVRPTLPDMATPEGQLQVAEMLLASVRERVEQAREIERQRAELDWAVPRAKYTDTFVDGSADATTVRDLAKQLQVQEKALRAWMVERHLVYRDRGTGDWKPRAQTGPRRHWFVLRDQPEAPRHHNGQMRTTLYVTPAGKVGIVELLDKHPLLGQAVLAV
jgi:DNA-damage-inducible protein D